MLGCVWGGGYTQTHVDNNAGDYFCWTVCGEGGYTQTHVDNNAGDYFCWAVGGEGGIHRHLSVIMLGIIFVGLCVGRGLYTDTC